METLEPVRKFRYIIELQELFGNKVANAYQFTSFSKNENGKWYIDYIPLFQDVDVLQMLENYKRNSTRFQIFLKLPEETKAIAYNAIFMDYIFSMDYESDKILEIQLIFKEVR